MLILPTHLPAKSYILLTILLLGWLLSACAALKACPFCTVVAPSLSQQADAATVVALAEVLDANAQPPQFQLHRLFKGKEHLPDLQHLSTAVDETLKNGSLVLLFKPASQKANAAWNSVTVNETSAGYFAKAPTLREPEAERLRYFARFLEHADPLIAEDAYREFGRAPFETVRKVAPLFSSKQVRTWLQAERVPPWHKGFYGLLLGLEIDKTERAENTEFLKKLIETDVDDFRLGFDGILGGYLLLTDKQGLNLLTERFLANPKSRVGDVRHAMTALRFYHEYGDANHRNALPTALAKVLSRPEFAESAITDLARWQAWQFCDVIAGLYDKPEFATSEIRRAIIGYLHVCPTPQAKQWLAKLRQQHPQEVQEAEAVLKSLGKISSGAQ